MKHILDVIASRGILTLECTQCEFKVSSPHFPSRNLKGVVRKNMVSVRKNALPGSRGKLVGTTYCAESRSEKLFSQAPLTLATELNLLCLRGGVLGTIGVFR